MLAMRFMSAERLVNLWWLCFDLVDGVGNVEAIMF